jgi:drug/metabolite transporter (DMT)-like permease
LFAETPSVAEFLAVSVSVLGLWLLAVSSRHGDAKHALPWTLLAALCTSIYSLSDKTAVAYLPGFAEQLGFISVGYAASFVGLTLLQRRETGQWIPALRPDWGHLLLGGVCIGVAYALVVRAMSQLPAAHVVSFTNAGIVLATLLSIFAFREQHQWPWRLAGALVVSLGLLILGWVR